MTTTFRSRRADERGFTLVELLVVVTMIALVSAIAVGAVRQYSLVRSLEGAADGIVAQLRQVQQRTMAESHPLVYGARFRVGSSEWGIVRFDPRDAATPDDDVCTQVETRSFDMGVRVTSTSTAPTSFATDPLGATVRCRSDIPGASSDQFVFFYARGDATAGRVTVTQPALGRSRTVEVIGVTGRVERR